MFCILILIYLNSHLYFYIFHILKLGRCHTFWDQIFSSRYCLVSQAIVVCENYTRNPGTHLVFEKMWFTRESFLVNWTCSVIIFKIARETFLDHFGLKMAKYYFLSYRSSTTAPKKYFGMHTLINPRYNICYLTLTLRVTTGHWRSLDVNNDSHNWG